MSDEHTPWQQTAIAEGDMARASRDCILARLSILQAFAEAACPEDRRILERAQNYLREASAALERASNTMEAGIVLSRVVLTIEATGDW